MSRRSLLRGAAALGLGVALPGLYGVPRAWATALATFLSDPAQQPKFVELAPNALDPAFLFKDLNQRGFPSQKPNYSLKAAVTTQETGLINPRTGRRLKTKLYGYGADTVSWPGQTFQVRSAAAGGPDEIRVRWENALLGGGDHLLPVDTNLHWCYSLHGMTSANGVDYRQYSIKKNGVPIITHLHGGHSDFQFDGNPEFFYSPDGAVKGPQWSFVDGGFTNTFRYDNTVPAGNLWYHDHALGITRLNVYAGLAGFYFVRDQFDSGLPNNPLGLPAFPYELAYAIQDRMFTSAGALFYPAFPGDPAYDDFITGEGAILPPDLFPNGGPTALAEFFGDHMVVNGKIWPKTPAEPRHYRLRLLNGCDSRFLVVRFRPAASLTATSLVGAGDPLPFTVIGADQGLGGAQQMDTLVIEPGSRYDVVIDFTDLAGQRVIMENIGGDAPFGGDFGDDLAAEDLFPNRQTDRIMAFDVTLPFTAAVPDGFSAAALGVGGGPGILPADAPVIRRVALFEGKDEFGRLQPLLGSVTDDNGTWVATPYTWSQPTTETPALGATEEWWVYNFTMDAHPIHLHLVHFEVLGRHPLSFEESETEVVLIPQHNGTQGTAAKLIDIEVDENTDLSPGDAYFENGRRDMAVALPDQVVRIRATFDKPGRYVWHCHILSHEDHEMMRVLQIGG